VTVTDRFVAAPPNAILASGTRVGEEDVAVRVNLSAGVSASLIVNERAAGDCPDLIV